MLCTHRPVRGMHNPPSGLSRIQLSSTPRNESVGHPASHAAPVDVALDMACESIELPVDPFESVGAEIAFRSARIYPAQEGLACGRFVEHTMQVGRPDATGR